jgi:hypothetical protein
MTEDLGPIAPDSVATAHRHRVARRRRASGIYGTVITAAVVASAGSTLSTAALAVAVLLTLIVYWTAEQYAEVLGEQAEHGDLPTWSSIRNGLSSTSSMVTATYIPVLALIATRLLGASRTTAANTALGVAVLLLLIHGWSSGRAADLRGTRLVAVTLMAGSLGLFMIVMKNFVITHLH